MRKKIKMVTKTPKGLNTKEAPMYRSLMNSREADLIKKWHYNPQQFLVGRKTTNHKTGEVKVEFSIEPRLLKPVESPLKNKDEKRMIEVKRQPNSKGTRLFISVFEYFIRIKRTPLEELMKRMERDIIVRTLNKVDGKRKMAADILGIKYTTLHEKIKKYDICMKREHT